MLAGIAMVALAAASWGTWTLFLRPTGLPATVTSPIVFAVMGVVALPFALRLPRCRWERATLALLFANAVFDGVNGLTFFGALSHTTVAIAVLTHYLAPILIAIAAPKLEGVVVRGTGVATVIALIGLVLVLAPWAEPATGALVGSVLGATSAVCYAGNVFTVRRLVLRIGATRAMAYHSLIAAVAMAPLAIAKLDLVTLPSLARLVVGATTIGVASGIAFAVGLARIGSARAAVLTYAEPLVAVVIGVLIWNEPIERPAIAGVVLVIAAGISVARRASPA